MIEKIEVALELDSCADIHYLKAIAQRLRLSPARFTLFALAFTLFTLIVLSPGRDLLLFISAWVVPLLFALRSLGRQTLADARQWLVYWIIFGALFGPLNVILQTAATVFPLFSLTLALLFALLYCPANDLCERIYVAALQPVWKLYQRYLGELVALAEADRPRPKH